MSYTVFINPLDNLPADKSNIFIEKLYKELSNYADLNIVGIDEKELYTKVLNKSDNNLYILNWIDPLISLVKINFTTNTKINEVLNILFLPIFLLKAVKFFHYFRLFLKNNNVLFYCHDLKTFSRFPLIKFLDIYARRFLIKFSTYVFFAEESSKYYFEKFYNLKIKNSVISRLGKYHILESIESKEQLRKKYKLPLDQLIITFAGTSRPNRDLSTSIERSILESGIFLIRMGRGHKKKFKNINLRVISGLIDHDIYDEIIKLSDYIISPGEEYLTSAVERAAIGLGVPVIGYNSGSTMDMCQDCLLRIDKLNFNSLSEELPSVESKTYEILQSKCFTRHNERCWKNEISEIKKCIDKIRN